MPEDEEERIGQAATAAGREIGRFLHDLSPRVVRVLLGNMNLSEEDILVIAARKNVPPDVLQAIGRDKRWEESYPIRLALVKNPKSPVSLSLSLARRLRIFDLEELVRNHSVPISVRARVEGIISEKLPVMELGSRKTLAKKAAGNVLLSLLRDAEPEVVRLCLDNPHLVEGHLFKVISRKNTVAETVRLIAEHPKWSIRPLVRLSLCRNPHTPLKIVTGFIRGLRTVDLRELYADRLTPPAVKPVLDQELRIRGIDPTTVGEERVYELSEEEIAGIPAEETGEFSDGSTS